MCQAFFLTSQKKLPDFFHIASYANGSIGIREIPWPVELADGEQPAYLVKYHTEGLWKDVAPWTGVFNPIDGALKDIVVPYLAVAIGYYDVLPPWVLMVTISFLGRNIMYGFSRSMC